METFAEYILNEKEISAKLEITYYLAKKRNIFFDCADKPPTALKLFRPYSISFFG